MTVLFALQTAAERLAAARAGLHTPLPQRLMGVAGIAVMLGIAWLLSADRRRINWRLVGMGVVLQLCPRRATCSWDPPRRRCWSSRSSPP